MSWRVQLAFQGGGARFIQHLAVATAFQSLESKKVIDITRVAGTSAGSLAAAVVASGIPAEEAAKKLEQYRQNFTQKLSMPSTVGAIARLCVGTSLVNSKNLEKVFATFWRSINNSDDVQYIKEMKKPLFIVATNVVNRKPVIFGDSEHDELIDSLVHSCSIPIVYRNFRDLSNNELVDGGLVENLPLDKLIEGREQFGDVIAISFRESKKYQMPNNQLQYFNAIYNIASAHNIEHIKKRVNRKLIFNIYSKLEPLNFETAFRDYGADKAEFGKLRDSAAKWITNRNRAHGQPPEGAHQIWVDEDPPSSKLLEINGQIYRSLFEDIPYKIVRRCIIVKAYSLLRTLRPSDSRGNQPDQVTQLYYIAPEDRRLYCMPIRLDWTGQNADNAARTLEIQCENSKKEIQPILCPIKGLYIGSEGDKTSEALVYFDPPLEPDMEDLYPVRIKDFALLDGVMEDLFSRNGSFIGIRNHAKWPIEDAQLILAVPPECPHVQVAWRESEDPNVFVAGDPIDPEDLKKQFDFLSEDFKLIGWRRSVVPPGMRFSAHLHLTDRKFQDGLDN